MIRTFLAINLSVATTRRIVEAVEAKKPGVGGARIAWVPAANLHVTVRFIGSIDEALVEGIAGRLGPKMAAHAPFEVRARGFGAFPSANAPRILWVGVEGGEPLVQLQREVEEGLVALGLPKEERPFHPHLTVGRVKESAGALSGWSSEEELGVSQVHEMVLYESRTAQRGAEYTARARLPLRKS